MPAPKPTFTAQNISKWAWTWFENQTAYSSRKQHSIKSTRIPVAHWAVLSPSPRSSSLFASSLFTASFFSIKTPHLSLSLSIFPLSPIVGFLLPFPQFELQARDPRASNCLHFRANWADARHYSLRDPHLLISNSVHV